MSLAEFDGLADDAARNAAIARALRWRACQFAPGIYYWTALDGREHEGGPPAYYTGGDGDPFDNWHLLAEVWRALPREKGQVWSYEDGADYHSVYRVSTGIALESSTPHRAACRALVAAGMVPKEESNG
jgi:hypothetical protein